MRICLFTLLIVSMLNNPSFANAASLDPSAPAEEYALFTRLQPYITEAITNYYGQPLQYMPDRIISHRGSIITVQITTFQQAHNPPYGTDTLTFRDSNSFNNRTPLVIRYLHKGDEWSAIIERFKAATLHDIQASFQLQLNGYQKYEYGQLLHAAEHEKELLPLVELNRQAIQELLHPVKPGFKNTINPVTFLQASTGYIVLKQQDGMNVVHNLTLTKSGWKQVSVHRRQGLRMQSELLWYMH
ncbi:MAG: DUF3888 domain-containing protein [Candidatus Pristimantibacillus sp.]